MKVSSAAIAAAAVPHPSEGVEVKLPAAFSNSSSTSYDRGYDASTLSVFTSADAAVDGRQANRKCIKISIISAALLAIVLGIGLGVGVSNYNKRLAASQALALNAAQASNCVSSAKSTKSPTVKSSKSPTIKSSKGSKAPKSTKSPTKKSCKCGPAGPISTKSSKRSKSPTNKSTKSPKGTKAPTTCGADLPEPFEPEPFEPEPFEPTVTPAPVPDSVPTTAPKLSTFSPTTIGSVTVGTGQNSSPTSFPAQDITPFPTQTQLSTLSPTWTSSTVASNGDTVTVNTEATGSPTLASRTA